MVKINWTLDAQSDLKEIYEYIAKDSKKYASIQIRKIKVKTQILAKMPEAGKLSRGSYTTEIREIVEGHYRILYRIKSSERIDILLVHHGARDLPRRKLK